MSAAKKTTKKKTAKKAGTKTKPAAKKKAAAKTTRSPKAKTAATKKKAKTAGKRTTKAAASQAQDKTKTTAKKNAVSGGSGAIRAARTIVAKLRDLALSYPETREDFPWDHLVVKVGKKVFVFLDRLDVVGKDVRFTVKLPHSNAVALSLAFATPTGYGMAKSGWVSFSFPAADAPPWDLMQAWLDESYRAIALKRAIKALDARETPG